MPFAPAQLSARVRRRLEPTAAGEFVRLKSVARQVNRLPGRPLVVDLGGGRGTLHKLLRPDLRSRYVVIDRVASGDGHRVVADLAALPVRPHTLDAACCSDALEHIPDDRAFLASFLEIVRPGGLAVIHVPSERTPPIKRIHDAVEESEAHDEQDFPHVRDGYSASQLTSLLHELVPDARIEAIASFSAAQSWVADFDWYLWYRKWHPLRAVTWVLSRLFAVGTPPDGPSAASSGLLVVVTLPVAADAPAPRQVPRMAST